MSENAPVKETIVIAEDSSPNRKILAHLLEKLGYNVIACESGQHAWDALNAAGTTGVVLIISDIMMPNMNGLELLQKVRESEKYKTTPLVLVTAVSEKDYIVRAKEMNVNGYVLKPVTFQRVTSKLQELFPTKTFPKLAG
ncbi:MAG TPA: response regulator [Bdellovibrionales bacterium]|nr:response regulator [Bdellovibrionales bacterium]